MASISSVTMRGFGNSTFVGSASLVVTLGYGLGEAAGVTVIDHVDVGWTAPRSRLHYNAPDSRPEFTAPRSRLHYDARNQ